MDISDGCRICGGQLQLAYRGVSAEPTPAAFAPAQHQSGMHGDFYRCRACATLQQPSLPAASQLHELYRQMSDDGYLREEEGRRRAARKLLTRLAPFRPRGRLLDVGCSYGLQLDEARKQGYEVLGLELSADGVRHAREALGLPVLQSSLEDAELEPGSFDAIVMTDVFEHLDDPVAALATCARLLAPGGVLLLTTPDPSSRVARIAGPRWWSLLIAHRCLVPRATMRGLLASNGLAPQGEHPYVRVFSLGYWLEGFSERGGLAARLSAAASTVIPPHRLLGAAMRDEWTYVARASLPLSASAGRSTST